MIKEGSILESLLTLSKDDGFALRSQQTLVFLYFVSFPPIYTWSRLLNCNEQLLSILQLRVGYVKKKEAYLCEENSRGCLLYPQGQELASGKWKLQMRSSRVAEALLRDKGRGGHFWRLLEHGTLVRVAACPSVS